MIIDIGGIDVEPVTMEKIVSLCKSRGYIFPGSEIYGGLANTWDYGPLGSELKKNIKNAWWKKFIQENDMNVGIDSAILMNPETWVASGHIGNFNDPLMDCKECKSRFRADKLLEEATGEDCGALTEKELEEKIKELSIKCPTCGKINFTEIRQFNLMFKTFQGVTEDSKAEIYLRPETAQGIFVNFKNIQRSARKKLPFGIGQIGKSFRNEITPGNFIFRTREFEQMELEFFCKPGEEINWYNHWKEYCHDFLLSLGVDKDRLRLREHDPEELAHYSNATCDIEFMFPFGWGELWGVASRTDYDLKQHMNQSGKDLLYVDPFTNEKLTPYCIEPSVGVERLLLTILISSYDEETIGDNDVRTVLRLHPALAPIKVTVLPLVKKLSEPATKLYSDLMKRFPCEYDEAGAIGRRYRRQDEIGTPFCVTFDFDSLEDGCVTVRHRDSMEQERIAIDHLIPYLEDKLAF